jgi:hypothetical protein
MIMSDAAVARISLSDARAPTCAFAALHRSAPPPPVEPAPVIDAYANGYAAGQQAAETRFAGERAALLSLIAAAEAFRPDPSEELIAMIATTVMALVTQCVGAAPVCADWLSHRIDCALGHIRAADCAQVLHLNPDDHDLLSDVDFACDVHRDPALERGAFRIACSSGWVEDGRTHFLAALGVTLGVAPDSAVPS